MALTLTEVWSGLCKLHVEGACHEVMQACCEDYDGNDDVMSMVTVTWPRRYSHHQGATPITQLHLYLHQCSLTHPVPASARNGRCQEASKLAMRPKCEKPNQQSRLCVCPRTLSLVLGARPVFLSFQMHTVLSYLMFILWLPASKINIQLASQTLKSCLLLTSGLLPLGPRNNSWKAAEDGS